MDEFHGSKMAGLRGPAPWWRSVWLPVQESMPAAFPPSKPADPSRPTRCEPDHRLLAFVHVCEVGRVARTSAEGCWTASYIRRSSDVGVTCWKLRKKKSTRSKKDSCFDEGITGRQGCKQRIPSFPHTPNHTTRSGAK